MPEVIQIGRVIPKERGRGVGHIGGMATARQVSIKTFADRLAVHCLRDMEMQLNEQEASLVDAFRRLPPAAATEIRAG